jgi:hypothetical protein
VSDWERRMSERAAGQQAVACAADAVYSVYNDPFGAVRRRGLSQSAASYRRRALRSRDLIGVASRLGLVTTWGQEDSQLLWCSQRFLGVGCYAFGGAAGEPEAVPHPHCQELLLHKNRMSRKGPHRCWRRSAFVPRLEIQPDLPSYAFIPSSPVAVVRCFDRRSFSYSRSGQERRQGSTSDFGRHQLRCLVATLWGECAFEGRLHHRFDFCACDPELEMRSRYFRC